GARSETGYHSLLDVVLRDNVLYFFVCVPRSPHRRTDADTSRRITCILVFNNVSLSGRSQSNALIRWRGTADGRRKSRSCVVTDLMLNGDGP
ncbi:unnamed protein product, partial [Mycena citricolor]